MNLYTLIALGLVIYIARDLLRVWVETRADATAASALRARVASLESDLEERTDNLQRAVDTLQKTQAKLSTRIEHLETIVTHEAWDRMQQGDAPPLDFPDPTEKSAEEPDPETLAAQWARRLRP